jgi:NAD-dependent SIR2 family protein deacetylase
MFHECHAQALVALVADGPVQYVVSQNVDGLHRRSGIPAAQLAEVHGNCFMERCPSCNMYYLRDFEMTTIGFQNTGRSCSKGRCRCYPSLVLHADWNFASWRCLGCDSMSLPVQC